ncbi:MAG: hypothetical protein N5P05_003770 [Chroococcopsis gigantea SAG 12.99]|jgi:putative membrane protein|nr:TIGR03943 family protein [Chlorogloea purpurea SAG 13.99]MDV3002164.1 hypothetical protein [Chroococcopsis gigantea SAG 12.99]
MSAKILLQKYLYPGLDIAALIGWGALLLKYSVNGQLKLLIHPNYFLLVTVTGAVLVVLGIFQIWIFLKEIKKKTAPQSLEHISLLPPALSSGLLVLAALSGIIFTPAPLTAQMALQRGVSESLPPTRVQAQSFAATVKPEDKSLIEWVRTLNAYPEPDAYTGQKAKVTGFVVHLPGLPNNYVLLSRFILTCCAVDAYPVGLPVKLPGSRQSYPPDSWLEIDGEMITQTLPVEPQQMSQSAPNRRQLVIKAENVKPIPTPSDPYGY